MRYIERRIGPVCLILLAAGCRDATQSLAPHPGGPVALAAGGRAAVLYVSTYLGGAGDDDAGSIVVDANGYVYITGETASIDFPATAGAFQASSAGLNDVVIAKFDPAGGLVYATYLGGVGDDIGHGLAIDAGGYAYVVGNTSSIDFPTTAGAYQATSPGRVSHTLVPFVTKLDPTGSALVYSTFLGGSTDAQAIDVAVDGAGNAYLTGVTSATDFPTTAGAFRVTRSGQDDAFVTALNATGSALVYSTYLGGSSLEHGRGIAVDAAGHAYVIGGTTSADFPTTPGAVQTAKVSGSSSHAAFVTKLNPSGSALVYSTYLGGTGSDATCQNIPAPRGSTATCNGNGNRYLTSTTGVATAEMARFWQHLANAGLISGTYTGVYGTTIGTHVPGSAFATSSVATTPPAPGRLSMITGLPRFSLNFSPTSRDNIVVLPPGG